MRKAFDANVPKFKPRLRSAMVVVSDTTQTEKEEKLDEKVNLTIEQPASEVVTPIPADISDPDATNTSELISNVNISSTWVKDEISNILGIVQSNTTERQIKSSDSLNDLGNDAQPAMQDAVSCQSTISSTVVPALPIDNSEARRQRLENVKRKVTEAVRPEVLIEPVPEDPALAAESVLGLVSDLETQLSQSRTLEKALRAELTESKAELARTVNDGRTSSGRLLQAEAQLVEKRKVMEEMLFEMGALEQERDQAVRMVQILTEKDKVQQLEFDDLRNRYDEVRRALDESKNEEDRLNSELDDSIAENSRLQTLLAEITRERDSHARNAEQLIRERDELTQAKKALEKVHQALSQARARSRE